MLYYLGLEPYKSRYTMQLSDPANGWMTRNWRKAGVEFSYVGRVGAVPKEINTGRVLDAFGRTSWAFDQVTAMLNLAEQGKITSRDVIYFEDMFHPGIEALFYTFHQFGIYPKFYTVCWAQSVDEFDFTYQMRPWMRLYERMVANAVSGIFVANTLLKDKLVESGVVDPKVHVVGLPFDSEEVLSRMPKHVQHGTDIGGMRNKSGRKNQVVFSSRCDTEKNPDFFLTVAQHVLRVRPDVTFAVCTSAKEVRSNDPELLGHMNIMRKEYPKNFHVYENLTKEAYYAILAESKIQFNCASQDWVSFTLLEASVAGCFPIYPYFRSFPETLNHNHDFMYEHKDVEHAVTKVLAVLDPACDGLWKPEAIKSRSWVHKRYDGTWFRMLMKMLPDCQLSSTHFDMAQYEAMLWDPYAPPTRPRAPKQHTL